jgi:hypothetical protein
VVLQNPAFFDRYTATSVKFPFHANDLPQDRRESAAVSI